MLKLFGFVNENQVRLYISGLLYYYLDLSEHILFFGQRVDSDHTSCQHSCIVRQSTVQQKINALLLRQTLGN